MMIERRSLLRQAGLVPLLGTVPAIVRAADTKADYTLRIATGLVELAPDHIVSTTLYNGQFPGPLLRLQEGRPVTVDIHNDSDTPELVHWHGQFLPTDVDGAAEEGSPFVPAHGMQRITFTPRPSGFRFYHTHVAAGGDLNRGTYTGQAGPVYIEPKLNPGAYDREVFLVLKEFAPTFSRGGDMDQDALVGAPIKALQQMGKAADDAAAEKTKGFEGILNGGVYHIHKNLGVHEAVLFGEYFFVEALDKALRVVADAPDAPLIDTTAYPEDSLPAQARQWNDGPTEEEMQAPAEVSR